jgi:hypothetical protein
MAWMALELAENLLHHWDIHCSVVPGQVAELDFQHVCNDTD